MIKLLVNGESREVQASPDTPLLYVLRGELDVMTPKFGCGLAQCGACSVLVDGAEMRACITPISFLAGKEVTTVDGLPKRWQQQQKLPDDAERLHPVQQAWIDKQVPQCGVCQYGMMIKTTELLEQNPNPTDADINDAMTISGPSAHLCRCGSYAAIREGIHHAADLMSGKAVAIYPATEQEA